jgi:hypothetical protein
MSEAPKWSRDHNRDVRRPEPSPGVFDGLCIVPSGIQLGDFDSRW